MPSTDTCKLVSKRHLPKYTIVGSTSEFIHICFLELFFFSVAMVQRGFPYGGCSVVTVSVLSCTVSFSRVI